MTSPRSPYFMLLFDSVGHYFRLRREMLSGSRFPDLDPFSPLRPLFFSLPSDAPSPFPASDPDNQGRNMSSFLPSAGQRRNGGHAISSCAYRHARYCLPLPDEPDK